MTAYIYLITKNNTPVYVGFTSSSINSRWSKHKYDAENGSTTALHRAIRKYGVSDFSIETLYESEDVNHTKNYMEHHYIWLHQTYVGFGGYNLTYGGEGAIGNVPDEHTRLLMSAAHKGRVFNAEWKAKISQAKKGKPRSEETKKKIAEAHKKNWDTTIITDAIRNKYSDMARSRWSYILDDSKKN
jgi:group I intron endonuclease